MTYKDYFPSYAIEIDNFLAHFFQEKKDEAKQIPVAAKMWSRLERFIVGGKRLRGGLVKLGYESSGGKRQKALLPVAAAVEITHGAILIHDDIIDQSEKRHGRPTIHLQYQHDHQGFYSKGTPFHYGQSMAILVGILGYYGALGLLSQTQFSAEKKTKAISQLCQTMIATGYGEGLDIDLACRLKIKEKAVLKIQTLKTAQYTLIGPLKIGGILAGASQAQLKAFEDYGLPVGIAFQLQDDILGMFGSEEKLGKPVGDDLKEGKNTLLYTQAIKKGRPIQKRNLQRLWEKRDIKPGDVEEARQIIKQTGSLWHCQEMAQRLVEEGKKAVPGITKDKKLQEVFLSLADFMVKREK